MIHINGEEITITEDGYVNLITRYCQLMAEDYADAVRMCNISKMVRIEKHILSDTFWGEVIGLTAKPMIMNIRESYDKDKYEVVRDPNTRFPIEVIKKKVVNNGES